MLPGRNTPRVLLERAIYRAGDHRRARGFGLLFMLLAVAALGAASMTVATDWTQQIQRDKESELLRVGDLYARAIASYYYSAPGPVRRYPSDMNELLEDRRGGGLRRHLRAAYSDPVTNASWGLVVAPDGGIMGVFSRSERQPWKRTALSLAHADLPPAQQYTDWKFIAKTP
jgi:type II secretory pathway pseudopilin PulG